MLKIDTPVPTPVPRETVASFVSRTAAHYGVNAATYCADKGTSFQKLIAADPVAISNLAEFNLAIPEILTDWSPSPQGTPRGKRLLRSHIFPSRVIQPAELRGCPMCLRADAAGSQHEAHLFMAMRGDWLVPHVTLCLEHQHPLVPFWKEAEPVARFDSAAQLAAISQRIMAGDLDVELRDETDFDIWLDRRLEGTETETWLESFPVHVAANFCFMMGCALCRHEKIAPSNVDLSDRWALYQMGFEVARDGEEAVRTALRGLQAIPGGPQDGPRKIFPVLYDRLAYDYRDDPDYAIFRDALRDHMFATWPLGVGDELLGEPVMERRLHSIRTAAQATAVDQRRLRKMLAARGLVPEVGRPDAWEVFDAGAAHAVLHEIRTLVPAKTFATLIGATRSQFDLLVTGDILAPSLTETDVKAVWDPAEGRAFLDELFMGAVQLRQPQHGWTHIAKSAQRLKVNPGEIIKAIRDGRITRVGNYCDHEGYAALYVDHDEVSGVLSLDEPDARSIELFSKSIGINQPSRMRRLIVNGHTPATRLQNPRTMAQQFYISPKDAEAFHRKFFTIRTMAKAYARSWQSLTADLKAKGVLPYSPDGDDYGSIYLTTEVTTAFS